MVVGGESRVGEENHRLPRAGAAQAPQERAA